MSDSQKLEYDVVIAGGGTAGCVIASRLATADPSMKILLIEAGPPVRDDLAHVVPARALSHLLPTSTTTKYYVGKEKEELGGRTPVVHTGQCLGGGSSINLMMYTRASASDYDDWERLYENPGWGYTDLLPLLKKVESHDISSDKPTHGYNGPLKVSHGGLFTEIGKQFLDVASKYDKTRPVLDDINDMHQSNAYARWAKWIDTKTGKRQDVPHTYIYGKEESTNLQIMTGYQVRRVLFEGDRATGIEFLPDARFHQEEAKATRIAIAKRLVVLSAGTFGSPPILERSGIGAKERLSTLGINIISDLPGVGENYQDHPVVFTHYFVDDEADTLDGLIQGNPAEMEKWTKQWIQDGSGLLAHNSIEAGSKLRPTAKELEAMGPVFNQRWQQFFANNPDKPVMWLACSAGFVGNLMGIPPRKYLTIGYCLWYSTAVGYLHVTSADDVDAPLDFDPTIMSSDEDLACFKWGYKLGREIARRMPLYRGEYTRDHPAFSPNSEAAPQSEPLPVEIAAPALKYTTEDDAAIDTFHRQSVNSMWHCLGTCAMKPRDQGGVVDSQLNVYGVKGLKVADMSIAPSNIGSNTFSTAVMIGEKAATIIAAELGLTI